MYSASLGVCTVHKEQNTTIVQYLFGVCAVHERCIHDQDYSKEEQQSHQHIQLKWLWSHSIGKQHW